MDAISGHDRADPSTSRRRLRTTSCDLAESVAGLRIGIVYDAPAPKSVSEAASVLVELGAIVSEIEVDWMGEGGRLQSIITAVEAAEVHGRLLRENPGGYSETIRHRLEVGALIPGLIICVRRERGSSSSDEAPTSSASMTPAHADNRSLASTDRSMEAHAE